MRILHVDREDHRRDTEATNLPDVVAAQRAAGHEATVVDVRAPVADVLDRFRPHVVHLHDVDGAAVLTPVERRGVPSVATLTTPPAGPEPDRLDRLDRLDGVDVLLCPSGSLREALVRDGVDADRLTLLTDGCDLRSLEPATEPGLGVLYAGPLDHDHGVDVLLDAVRHLPSAVPVTIAGDGPMCGSVLDRAARLGAGRLTVLGPLGTAERRARIRAAAVLVVPSRSAGRAFATVLEAFGSARPVVASSVGDLPELVADGLTGAIVPPADVRALAEALRILTIDPAVAFQQGREARRRAEERFGLAAHVAGLDRVYALATARRHGTA